MRFAFPLFLAVAACGGSEKTGPVDWNQAEFEPAGEFAHDWKFGHSIALSPDGSALAISSSRPASTRVWRPASDEVSELPVSLAIAPGPSADRFYCLKWTSDDGYGLHEYSAASKSWRLIRKGIESRTQLDRLEMSPSHRRQMLRRAAETTSNGEFRANKSCLP